MSEQTIVQDATRFYAGLGIDQRRCAPCAVAPTLPCAVHRDYEPCTGAGDCPSLLHEHGCYADRDGLSCNDPADHEPTPPATDRAADGRDGGGR